MEKVKHFGSKLRVNIKRVLLVIFGFLLLLILQLLEQERPASSIGCRISGLHKPLIFTVTPYLFWIKMYT